MWGNRVVCTNNNSMLYVPINFVGAPHEWRHGAFIRHVWIHAFRHQIRHDGRVTELRRQVYA